MNTKVLAAAAVLAFSLAACTTGPGPVEVTRFSRPDIASVRGAVSIEPVATSDSQGLEYGIYADAVANELNRLGFTRQNDAPTVARIGFRRDVIEPGKRGSPVSVGVGGATGGGWGSSVGMGVGIDLSGPPPAMANNSLIVTLVNRTTGQSIWEGRAQYSVKEKSPEAQTTAVAARLASALFKDFPGKSGETVQVK